MNFYPSAVASRNFQERFLIAMTPKVSVIIACYNDKNHISETIQSVLDQTYENMEIIVVDDGSTDRSPDLVRENFPGVKLITKENGGPASARNCGAQLAKGDFLQFQDSDDLIEKDKIRLQIEKAMEFPGQIIYGPIRVFRSVKGINTFDPPMELLDEKEDVVDRWLRGWFTIPTALLWPRAAYEKVGGFDENLSPEEDTDIALRAVLMGYRLIACPHAFSYYRSSENPENGSTYARNSQTQMNPRKFKSRVNALEKFEKILHQMNLMPKYREAIAIRYFTLARTHVLYQPELSMYCYRKFKSMSATGRPPGSLMNWIGIEILGLPTKERLADVVGNYGTKLRKVFR